MQRMLSFEHYESQFEKLTTSSCSLLRTFLLSHISTLARGDQGKLQKNFTWYSVTRRLPRLFAQILPLKQFAQSLFFANVSSNFCQILNKPSKIAQRLRISRQIWSHWSPTCTISTEKLYPVINNCVFLLPIFIHLRGFKMLADSQEIKLIDLG